MESSLETAKVPIGPERRVLELIYETFHADAEWLTFQYLGARVWQELEVEARDVYYALSAAGLVRPRIQRGRAYELRDDTKVGINLRGLMHLREAADDVAHFLSVIRCIGERAARFRPSTATEVEHLHVTSEELRVALGFHVDDLALQRQAILLRDEAYSMWISFSGLDASGAWSVVLNPERARRYRTIETLGDFFTVEAAIHADHAPPVITRRIAPPVAIPIAANDESAATSDRRRDRGGPPRAFISYSHRDRAFVEPFEAALRKTGVDVWIDHADLLIGDSLVSRIGDAIRDGDFVVAVVSSYSVTSPWCVKELALAMTHGIRSQRIKILPLRLGEVRMPSFLEDTVWEDADLTDPVAAAERIASTIRRHLESQSDALLSTAEPRLATDEGRADRLPRLGAIHPKTRSAAAPAPADALGSATAAPSRRDAAAILELGSPTPGAPDHWVLCEGMLLLRLVLAPVPGGVRHPAAADPRDELEVAVRRGAQLAHARTTPACS
jgi:hypothetical protein